MTLFDTGVDPSRPGAPLAVRMRPQRLEDIVGQPRALAPGGPLDALARGEGTGVSVILWGPPGTGKTTIAHVISRASGRVFTELSAVTAGVKDVRAVIDAARERLALHGTGTVLFIDEVHRFSKSQQDALLPAVENGWVTLIAATTENPSFSVISPLLSRSVMVILEPLTDDAIRDVLDRAIAADRGLAGTVDVSSEAVDMVVRLAQGDARRALTYLEAATLGADTAVTEVDVERAVQRAVLRYDKDGDQHYDVISAFIKSVRGSDVNAALHYLARMLTAGEDPRFVARRLMILASEDIGLADSSVLQTATAAAHAVAMVGMPEAQIILAHATIHASLAPKSNAVVQAIGAAMADVNAGKTGQVPLHLRDAHYPGAARVGHGTGYLYPHDDARGISAQQYLPDVLAGAEYYRPSDHGAEERWARVYREINDQLQGAPQEEGE